jgi:hypothetical protein
VTTASARLQVVEVAIDELRPDPANPRRIAEAELEALTRSLREFGFVQNVLARREDKPLSVGTSASWLRGGSATRPFRLYSST